MSQSEDDVPGFVPLQVKVQPAGRLILSKLPAWGKRGTTELAPQVSKTMMLSLSVMNRPSTPSMAHV
jgi:hypothetical protein